MGGHGNESSDMPIWIMSLRFVVDIQAPTSFSPGELKSCSRAPSRAPHFQCGGEVLYRVLSSLPMHDVHLGSTMGINFFSG